MRGNQGDGGDQGAPAKVGTRELKSTNILLTKHRKAGSRPERIEIGSLSTFLSRRVQLIRVIADIKLSSVGAIRDKIF